MPLWFAPDFSNSSGRCLARSLPSFSMEIPVMFRGVTNSVKTVSLLVLTYHGKFLATFQIAK